MMTTQDQIIREIQKIPESMLEEVLDFIRFLESKLSERRIGTAIASESSLKKDWLNPTEDEAWKEL